MINNETYSSSKSVAELSFFLRGRLNAGRIPDRDKSSVLQMQLNNQSIGPDERRTLPEGESTSLIFIIFLTSFPQSKIRESHYGTICNCTPGAAGGGLTEPLPLPIVT